MRKSLLILLLVFSGTVFGQETKNNDERLKEIETEIQRAVNAGDFDKATALKEERDIRNKIKQAIATGDFDRAEDLRNQLSSGSETQTQTVADDVYIADVNTLKNETPKERTQGSQAFARLLKTGFYLEMGLGSYSTSSEYGQIDYSGFSIKARMGFKIFFGGKGNKSRFGLDISIVEPIFLLSGDNWIGGEVQFIRPGAVYSVALNEKMAIDASVNVGTSYMWGEGDFYGGYYDEDLSINYSMIGITVSQSTRLRLYKWAFLGFDIGYTTSITDVDSNYSDSDYYWDESTNLNSFNIMYVMGIKF